MLIDVLYDDVIAKFLVSALEELSLFGLTHIQYIRFQRLLHYVQHAIPITVILRVVKICVVVVSFPYNLLLMLHDLPDIQEGEIVRIRVFPSSVNYKKNHNFGNNTWVDSP